MKTIEIKHRFTGDVLFSFECETIKECVVEAVRVLNKCRSLDYQCDGCEAYKDHLR